MLSLALWVMQPEDLEPFGAFSSVSCHEDSCFLLSFMFCNLTLELIPSLFFETSALLSAHLSALTWFPLQLSPNTLGVPCRAVSHLLIPFRIQVLFQLFCSVPKF